MDELLEKLTKTDLIIVIAHMHDKIQNWEDGYGNTTEEADMLNKVGNSATEYCVTTQNWKLPKITEKK